MEFNKLHKSFTDDIIKRVKISPVKNGYRMALPLFEPNGDQIFIHLEESSDGIKVHDGGHISGVLFGVGPRGAARSDYNLASKIIENAEFQMDRESGVVFVKVSESDLNYWIMELGRTVAVIASVIPVNAPPLRPSITSSQS